MLRPAVPQLLMLMKSIVIPILMTNQVPQSTLMEMKKHHLSITILDWIRR